MRKASETASDTVIVEGKELNENKKMTGLPCGALYFLLDQRQKRLESVGVV